MKNQILALLVLVALFGFTATGAQAHTTKGPSFGSHTGSAHGSFVNHHRYYRNGGWYEYNDGAWILVPDFVPGVSLIFNF